MLYFFILFIFGLCVGSFLNCVVYRLETGQSFLKGRSFCPYCKHKLSFFDLIPIASYLALKGRCRYCKKSISLQYPLVELVTGFLFVLVFSHLSRLSQIPFEAGCIGCDLVFWLLIFSFLTFIFIYDLKHYIIPDQAIYPAIIISAVYHFNVEYILSGFFASLFFFAIFAISRGRGMGFGDVKLAFLMGLILGFPGILVALFFAFLIGAIMGIGLIFFGAKSLKSEVPFGPFLIIGVFIALFLGHGLVEWYLNLLI